MVKGQAVNAYLQITDMLSMFRNNEKLVDESVEEQHLLFFYKQKHGDINMYISGWQRYYEHAVCVSVFLSSKDCNTLEEVRLNNIFPVIHERYILLEDFEERLLQIMINSDYNKVLFEIMPACDLLAKLKGLRVKDKFLRKFGV